MWKTVAAFLLDAPTICIFLCLCLGYLLGKVRIKKFKFGSTVGVLVIALLVGQLGAFKIDPIVKGVFFDLFIFTIGYEVGPAFVSSLKKSGAKLIAQSIFFSVAAFLMAFGLFRVFGIDPGEGAGIIAGSLTQSATIGTAASAISTLNLSAAQKQTFSSEIAIAYAITYVFGTIGVLFFLKSIAPAILRVDLKEETKKVVETLHFTQSSKTESAILNTINVRAFNVENNEALIGRTVGKFERDYGNQFVVEQIVRGNQSVPFEADFTIQPDDTLLIVGDADEFADFVNKNKGIEERAIDKFQSIDLQTAEVILTKVFSYSVLGKMLNRSVMVTKATRDGTPIEDLTTLRVGDHLNVIGPSHTVTKVIPELGYAKVDGPETDISFLSIGIVIGVLIGSAVVHVAGIPLTLGAGGGALFAGLYLGWYHSQHQNFGLIPTSTRWFLKSMGLNTFIAVVGLEAGVAFLPALKSMGVKVLLIGAVVSIFPHFVSILFGKYILKLNAVDNIGCLTGAGTITAALNAISEDTGSSVFAISYTPAYAVGNILLTVMGPLIVAVLK